MTFALIIKRRLSKKNDKRYDAKPASEIRIVYFCFVAIDSSASHCLLPPLHTHRFFHRKPMPVFINIILAESGGIND